jgi:hypothetical protein
MIEKEYGKAAMKIIEVYKWHKIFMMVVQVSMMICLGHLSTTTNDKSNKCCAKVTNKLLY